MFSTKEGFLVGPLKAVLPGYRHCGLLVRGFLGLVNAGVYVGGMKTKRDQRYRGWGRGGRGQGGGCDKATYAQRVRCQT